MSLTRHFLFVNILFNTSFHSKHLPIFVVRGAIKDEDKIRGWLGLDGYDMII